MIIDFLQGMEQGIAGGILLVFSHGVFQVKHDGIGFIYIRVFDEARF